MKVIILILAVINLLNVNFTRSENLEQCIVCLVKCQEQVLASTMLAASSVPSKQDMLRFPGTLALENLRSNFAVTLEVYTLQARRETISHEAKYHIKKVKLILFENFVDSYYEFFRTTPS